MWLRGNGAVVSLYGESCVEAYEGQLELDICREDGKGT